MTLRSQKRDLGHPLMVLRGQAEKLLRMLCSGFISRLPRVATSVSPSVSAYQGTTLVGPYKLRKELGFSPCLLLPGKAKKSGAKSSDLCCSSTARLRSCPDTRIPRDRQTLLPAGAAIQSQNTASKGVSLVESDDSGERRHFHLRPNDG